MTLPAWTLLALALARPEGPAPPPNEAVRLVPFVRALRAADYRGDRASCAASTPSSPDSRIPTSGRTSSTGRVSRGGGAP